MSRSSFFAPMTILVTTSIRLWRRLPDPAPSPTDSHPKTSLSQPQALTWSVSIVVRSSRLDGRWVTVVCKALKGGLTLNLTPTPSYKVSCVWLCSNHPPSVGGGRVGWVSEGVQFTVTLSLPLLQHQHFSIFFLPPVCVCVCLCLLVLSFLF